MSRLMRVLQVALAGAIAGAGVSAFAAGAAPTVVQAQAGSDRERIASERAAATARLAEQERVCRTQFVVTACVDAAQREFRVTQARLRREELALDEAARRAAAARRKQEIAERAAAQASQPADAGPAVPREGARRMPSPNAPAAPAPIRSRRASSAEDQRAEELRNEAALEARVRAAQAHRAAVERRNAERAARGKVAAPLPMPSAASAP